MRAVIDTGVIVSALIRRDSLPGRVLLALRDGRFTAVYSTDTLMEVVDVLGREVFRTKYHVKTSDVTALLNLIRLRGELVIPSKRVQVCRDPKDDKFLEAALEGDADCIVTGDADLLVMGAYTGILIISARAFLERL